MTDERNEELAALHAFDLLEGDERLQFEAALARDPELQALVRELRETSAQLAHTRATPPPAALKERVLASIADRAAALATPVVDNLVRPAVFGVRQLIPWAIAAGFALIAGWLGQRYFATHSEATILRQQQALADLALQGIRQQLEAERLIARRQTQDLDRQLTTAASQLAQARADTARLTGELAAAGVQSAALSRQLVEARARVTAGESQVAALTQKVDALAGATADLTYQLEQTRTRIAQLTADLVVERDLAEYKISVLASLVKDNPQAVAVALWDPGRKQGVLKVDKLPALAANQDYQLWVIDPQYKDPVDGGVFTVDPRTGIAKVAFTAKQPVNAVNAFAVSLERKGGVPKAEGPIVLLGK